MAPRYVSMMRPPLLRTGQMVAPATYSIAGVPQNATGSMSLQPDRLSLHQLEQEAAVLMSKDDDKNEGKAPPKGFEKFFKKRDQRKDAAPESSGDTKEGEGKESGSAEDKEGEKEKPAEKESSNDKESKDSAKSGGSSEWDFSSFLQPGGGGPGGEYTWLLVGLALCAVIGAANYRKPMEELIYMDFLNQYLLKNQVKEINITKDRRSAVFNYRAEIEMVDGKQFYMVLGSQESFLAKLDLVQR